MLTTTLFSLKRYLLCLVLAAPLLSGCGMAPERAAANNEGGSTSGSTVQSTIEDPDWGAFELLAQGQNPETGKYDFVVRANRSAIKNQLRFVWDFGNGPEGEGLEQSHEFAVNGTYLITVTAYGVDDSIAFVLKLTANIGVSNNQAPISQGSSEEYVGENDLVFLYGGNSSDPDGDEITYEWVQLYGPPVQILHAKEASASFISPLVDEDEELEFRLMVSDGELTGHSDVVVVVSNLLDPSGTTDEDSAGIDMNGDGVVDAEDARVNCVATTPEWKNLSFSPQSGVFEISFNASPDSEFMDAVVGLAKASSMRFSGSAVLIRFSPEGVIDVRNGGGYDADRTVRYSPNVRYQFRAIVNVPTRTYSVFVTPGDETEINLATDYAFRTEQSAAASLGYWSLWSDVGTTLKVCSLRVSNTILTADAGADVTVSPGGSTVLQGEATGGQGPHQYEWTPATGLSNAHIANPTVTPTATTAYKFTVTDVWGSSSSDIVMVNVRDTALVAKAGDDLEINAGGTTQLEGSATGGTPPYTYRWSPATGLSSATDATPIVEPSATTTYTLTVTDSAAESASDAVVVTVRGAIPSNAFVVARNAANASDNNPGTEAAPWKTLAKAAETVRAGQTVLVKSGTYFETLRPSASGTAGNLITFKAYPGDECKGTYTKTDCRVIIDGQGVRENGVDLNPRKYIRIEGFEIRKHTGDSIFLQGYGEQSSVGNQIVNNFIHDSTTENTAGVTSRRGTRDLLVENNEIRDIYTALWTSSEGMVLRNNHLWHTHCEGIRGGGNNILIEGNHIHSSYLNDPLGYGCHQDGIDTGAEDMNGVTIRNNILHDFTQLIYFAAKDNADVVLQNIDIYGNVLYTDEYWTLTRGEAPGIFVDARRNDSVLRNVRIFSNTFGWLGYGAVWLQGNSATAMSNITITGNIFSESGIDVSSNATGVYSDYNLFNLVSKPSYEGSHSIVANPQFVNYSRHSSWDFRLKPTSPAIDRADPNLGSRVTLPPGFVDMAGTVRPTGSTIDLGAYEYRP